MLNLKEYMEMKFMADESGLFKCKTCESILEIVVPGPKSGELDDLEPLIAKSEGEGAPKHVPIIERDGENVVIKVSEIAHPMETEHLICFIELIDGDIIYRKTLKPGDEPKASFKIDTDISKLRAREYCNLHGLWKS
jgi:superoxide reductase